MNGKKKPICLPIDQWVADIFDKKIPDTVFFRVDGGKTPGLSMGHVQRCLLLARALKQKGGNAVFLMACDRSASAYVEAQGIDVSPLCLTDPADLSILETITGIDHLVVDLPYPDLDIHMLETLHKTTARVVFIDDARFIFPKVGAVLNSSIRACQALNETSTERMPSVFLGPEFFIMPEIPKVTTSVPRASLKILLSFGGSDPTGLTLKTVRALADKSIYEISYTIVLGPCFGKDAQIMSLARDKAKFHILRSPASLLRVMLDHDLLICAGGRTMYEASALGLPFFPIASTAIEAEEILAFSRQGFLSAFLLEWDSQEFLTGLALLTDQLKQDKIA